MSTLDVYDLETLSQTIGDLRDDLSANPAGLVDSTGKVIINYFIERDEIHISKFWRVGEFVEVKLVGEETPTANKKFRIDLEIPRSHFTDKPYTTVLAQIRSELDRLSDVSLIEKLGAVESVNLVKPFKSLLGTAVHPGEDL